MKSKQRFDRRRRWLLSIVVVLGLTTWWFISGPRAMFSLQVWLLEQGVWMPIAHWENHGQRYMPFLIEETANFRSSGIRYFSLPTGADGFEAYAHYEVETVSDCARMVLRSLTGVDDGVGFSIYDGTTNIDREKASRFWKKWYENRTKIRLNAQENRSEIVP